MGRQRLHAHVRRLPAARWAHGRPARPPPHVHRRPDPVRRRLACRRPRPERRLVDRRARRPGPRRRAALPGRPVAGHRDLRGGRGTQQGARRMGRGRRLRRRRRRAARRHAHRVGRLGMGAVRQRADRHRRGADGHAPAAREPQRRRAPLRHRGRGHGHRRPVAAGLLAGQRQRRGLGLDDHVRPARRRGRAARLVRADRAAHEGAAGPVPGHLPHPHDPRHQRHRPADRDGAVLDVLLHLALHAAGARLRRARGRPRLPAAGGGDHHLGRHRVEPDDQARRQAGAHPRPDPDRDRPRLVRADLARGHLRRRHPVPGADLGLRPGLRRSCR